MTTTDSPSGDAPSHMPASPDGDGHDREHRRDRRELEQLLKVAHRNLDAAGVPRTTPT